MITIDSRQAGGGKTISTIYPKIKQLYLRNQPTLIVVPSVYLQEQYQTGLKNLPLKVINSVITDGNVSNEIIQSMAALKPLIIITSEAFMRTHIAWDIKVNYDIIIDEALNPYSFETLNFDPKLKLRFDSVFECVDEFPSTWNILRRMNVETSSFFSESSQWRRLNNPNNKLWVDYDNWIKIKEQVIEKLYIAVELSPSILTGYRSCHIAAAAFEFTFMSWWMKNNKLNYSIVEKFIPHTQVPLFHLPEDFKWSQTLRKESNAHITAFKKYVEETLNGSNCLIVKNGGELINIENEESIKHNAHGQNHLTHHTNICLTTALNPSNGFKSFLRAQFDGDSNYFTKTALPRAFAGYMFYQLIMRTALRMKDNTKQCQVFLIDSRVGVSLFDFFDLNKIDLKMIPLFNKSKAIKKLPLTSAEKMKRHRAKQKLLKSCNESSI